MAKTKSNLDQLDNQGIDWKKSETTKSSVSGANEISKTFTRHAWPREVIEHAKYKLYPIEGGVVKYFNRTKGEWFITPDDNMKKDIWVRDYERAFKDGEKVNYIKVNHEALVTSKGVVSSKSIWGDTKFLFISPDTGGNNVALSLRPTYPVTNNGHANFADKTKPEYTIDFKSFDDGDEVEFVANTKGNVVAIKKIEK